MAIKRTNIIYWGLRLIAACLMLQSLSFKFSAAPESVYIFSKLGMEPWGRIGTGCLELVASLLILWPKTTAIGALLTTGLMSGALFFHFTTLGIVVQDDSGELFIYALLILISALILLLVYKRQILNLLRL